MRKYIARYVFIWLLLLPATLLPAQEYLEGSMLSNGTTQPVFYDRTQLNISPVIFQSVYKIFNQNKQPLYNITITHDRAKAMLFVALQPNYNASQGFAVNYEKDAVGLFLSNSNNFDTTYSTDDPHLYLISFTDAVRDFPILHKIRTQEGDELILDPVTRIRLKIHGGIVKRIPPSYREMPEPEATFKAFYHLTDNDALTEEIFKARMELHAQNDAWNAEISEERKKIEQAILSSFKKKQVTEGERLYEGDRRRGLAHGKGLQVVKGSVYSGTFNNGQFTEGTAWIKNPVYEYFGGYAADTFSGKGWCLYANGNYLIGVFDKNGVAKGISMSKDKDADKYYGWFINNQRTGYGELRNLNGSLYYGQFLNGKLVRGYAREVDQFGYTTFSKIENGTKVPAAPKVANAFFDAVSPERKN